MSQRQVYRSRSRIFWAGAIGVNDPFFAQNEWISPDSSDGFVAHVREKGFIGQSHAFDKVVVDRTRQRQMFTLLVGAGGSLNRLYGNLPVDAVELSLTLKDVSDSLTTLEFTFVSHRVAH